MTEAEFRRWVQTAKPGESVVYWHRPADKGSYPAVADAAWEMGNGLGGGSDRPAGAGLVALVQRRVAGGWDYIAQRIRQ